MPVILLPQNSYKLILTLTAKLPIEPPLLELHHRELSKYSPPDQLSIFPGSEKLCSWLRAMTWSGAGRI